MKDTLRRWLAWLWTPAVADLEMAFLLQLGSLQRDLRAQAGLSATQDSQRQAEIHALQAQQAALIASLAAVQSQTAERLATHQQALDAHAATLETRTQQEQREVWMRRVAACTWEQRQILDRVMAALEAPPFVDARVAVREMAQTLNFNHPEMWVPYGRALKADPGQAENVFRHVKAVHDVKAALAARGIQTSNPDLHLAVELAYVGMTVTS